MKKVIARIYGGLGNQLFCYAAARRLALVNNAELVLDDVTGFVRDFHYRRQYVLDRFNIPARKATRAERLEPFERYRRGAMKWLSRKRSFAERRYVEQEGLAFDERLLTLGVRGIIYLDGYWQSEKYFKDVEEIIRNDLRITPPEDAVNQNIAKNICACNAVSLHVRWFDAPNDAATHNVSMDYYRRAIAFMDRTLEAPFYFIFSDHPEAARGKLPLPEGRVAFVSHNRGDKNAYADLWLMSMCKHFIVANSTFSWWGAWLGERDKTLVVCPKTKVGDDQATPWNFTGQIPSRWLAL